jgi:uncharacterized protein involved in exopolysaccharide biosynthesis
MSFMDHTHHDAFQRTCTSGFASHSDDGSSRCAGVHAESGGGLNPLEIIHILRTHSRWWLVPAVVCTVLAAAYALVAPRHWRATQALIVRPEAASVSEERAGKFSDLSEMKTLQETILELAKSHGVIQATLAEVGPSGGRRRSADWPSPRDIEDFREQVDMRPPGGAEFGKTEVFYLSVLDSDRVWATHTLSVLCNELQQRMQDLRDQRAQSMIAELKRAVELAENDLAGRTTQLSQFEAKIGADLVELRNLNATTGGPGEVSLELQAIETERRANESQQRENSRLLALLQAAEKDPAELLATPSSLLRSQPPVDRLKTALIDAQIHTAALLGSRSESHPFVVGARAAENAIRDQLHAEIDVAIRALEVDLALNADREAALAARWLDARQRISRLAESRAEYANFVSAAENHTKLVETARKNLADARARQAAAHSASVINRIDGVEAGVRPIGPGRTMITAAGGFGGLLLGLGLVFLFASPAPQSVAAASNVNQPTVSPNAAAPSSVESHAVRAEPSAAQSPNHVLVGVPLTKNAIVSPLPIPATDAGRQQKFGLSTGRSLDEALRQAEGKFEQRTGW